MFFKYHKRLLASVCGISSYNQKTNIKGVLFLKIIENRKVLLFGVGFLIIILLLFFGGYIIYQNYESDSIPSDGNNDNGENKKVEANYTEKLLLNITGPVDIVVGLSGELNSAKNLITASWGTMKIDSDNILITLEYGNHYDITLLGAGDGTMNLDIDFDTNEGLNSYSFRNVPITSNSNGIIYANAADCDVEILLNDKSGVKEDEIWLARSGETVYEADVEATNDWLNLDQGYED